MPNWALRHLTTLALCLSLGSSHMVAQQVRLVNVIPNSMSGENGRDSEPSIAVNAHNPLQITISSFTRDPGGGADAPLFLSTDGGSTWTLSTPIITGHNPSACVATLCDISLRFADSSDFLYVSALSEDPATAINTYRIQRIGTLFGTPASDLLWSQTSTDSSTLPSIRDQPYIESHTALGASGTGQDHIVVPYNDLTFTSGMTASVDHTVNAVPPSPAGISNTVVEARATTGQDSPSVRAAANLDGTVYVAFTGRRSGGNEIVVVKDLNWGAGTTPFQALLDGTTPGIRVVTGLTQSLSTLGTQRVSSPLSIAVHPTDSNTVYVAYAEGSTAAAYTIHVRNSTNGGSSWNGDLFTVTSATNPSLAVNNKGEAGLLYQRLTGSGTSARFESHFVLSSDGSFSTASNTDILLASVPTDAGPLYTGANPIGDYTGLMTTGKTFYGVFSANNTPNTANFHSSLSYPRNHNFTTHTLTDLMGAAVDISVDPFFFSVTNTTPSQDFYVRDWSDSPTSHDEGQEPSSNPFFYVNSDVWNRRDNTRGSYDPATDRPDHQDPQESGVGHNFAFTRVHRKAVGTGTASVDVHATFLVADFGLSTQYVTAGTVAAPTLTFAPADTVKDLGDGQGYQWDLPATHSDHVCIAVQIDAPNDAPAGTLVGHAPGWPTTDLMVINDNNKAQRNMGVWYPPAGGTDIMTQYFMVHNAALVPRDVLVRIEIAPEVLRVVRVAEIAAIGGRQEKPLLLREPQSGQVVTLSHMQPGENRWMGVTIMVSPLAPLGRFFPVSFTEVVNGQAVNGVDIGPRVDEPEAAFHENLLAHAAVFRRLAALYSFKEAAVESEEATKLSRSRVGAPVYEEFVQTHIAAIGALAGELVKAGASRDPFGLSQAVARLQTVLAANNALNVAVAHAALLEKFDAFTSMLDKAKGDTADILQNVYWQKALFTRVALPHNVVAQVTDRSANFIRAYERNNAGANDFPKLVDSLLPAYEAVAEKLSAPALKSAAAEMKDALRNPQQLQKAHSNFLLALQGYAK